MLALLMCVSVLPSAFAHNDHGSHGNFKAKHSYNRHFKDVHEDDWFCPYVGTAYEYGLVNGVTDSSFEPDSNLSIAQAITIAARIHCVYSTGNELTVTAPEGSLWYDPYVEYALENGIISEAYPDYDALAKRCEVAVIFASTLPSATYSHTRTIGDGVIPDVAMSDDYADSVYKLYRAGILSGNDEKGTFAPDSNIKRSEVAAICVRIADPAQRSSKSIGAADEKGNKLSAEEIADKCTSAVFTLDCYGFNGRPRSLGSGFFISSDGLAITNYHVAANSGHMIATTPDGKVYDDITVISTDKKNDLALLRINASGVKYLELGDSSTVKQGQKVYAIGSPMGLDNTFSDGIVSNTSRDTGRGIPYIQITAQIAGGSSGGALVDEYGEVVGVNTAGFDVADLNLAVPINLAKKLDKASTLSLLCFKDTFYPNYEAAYDFGAFSGVMLIDYALNKTTGIFQYDAFDFVDSDCFVSTMRYYSSALISVGFEHVIKGDMVYDGVYVSESEVVIVSVDLYDTRCITIIALKSPEYYKDFPTLIDFGWYIGLPLTDGPSVVENSIMYTYNWSKYTDAESAWYMMAAYATYLQEYGYEVISYSDDFVLLENDELSVVLILDNHNIYLDIQPVK